MCLFETTKTKPNRTCVAPVGQWFLGYDRFDVHEWFPYSNQDFLGLASALWRLSQTVGLRRGDVVLAVVDTPPHISSFLPYLWSYAEESRGCGLEFISGSLEWYDALAMSWITFMQKRRPTVILSSKRNAVALAEKLQVMETSVNVALPELRAGVFFGDGEGNLLEPHFSVESFEVCSPIEHMGFWSECRCHSGIHTWLDSCIPEILLDGKKEAELLRKSAVGAEGELVITNFAAALPLVRYRTGKRIRVESVGQCGCGANHPKIKFSQ
jgi:phenylacetate-coenzyme A ligase PaaK-like adenylate-forming protein